MPFFIFVNVVSFAVAIWVFFDSQKRGSTVGRSLLWAAGVFLVLIVFLPLYLAARKKKERAQAAAREASTPPALNMCFYCRQAYEGSPSSCPHCGQNLKM